MESEPLPLDYLRRVAMLVAVWYRCGHDWLVDREYRYIVVDGIELIEPQPLGWFVLVSYLHFLPAELVVTIGSGGSGSGLHCHRSRYWVVMESGSIRGNGHIQ